MVGVMREVEEEEEVVVMVGRCIAEYEEQPSPLQCSAPLPPELSSAQRGANDPLRPIISSEAAENVTARSVPGNYCTCLCFIGINRT